MNAPTSAPAADEKLLPVKLAEEEEISNLVEQENPKLSAQINDDAERIRSSLARLTSNSVDELEGLMSELEEVREFLRSEGERVQREIVNYAQLNQSALAATKIIIETMGPWKSTAVAGGAQNSGARPLLASARERLRRWPAPAG
jgi:hypothetical protein